MHKQRDTNLKFTYQRSEVGQQHTQPAETKHACQNTITSIHFHSTATFTLCCLSVIKASRDVLQTCTYVNNCQALSSRNPRNSPRNDVKIISCVSWFLQHQYLPQEIIHWYLEVLRLENGILFDARTFPVVTCRRICFQHVTVNKVKWNTIVETDSRSTTVLQLTVTRLLSQCVVHTGSAGVFLPFFPQLLFPFFEISMVRFLQHQPLDHPSLGCLLCNLPSTRWKTVPTQPLQFHYQQQQHNQQPGLPTFPPCCFLHALSCSYISSIRSFH